MRRVLLYPVYALRDLPIGWKLALTSVGALALLSAVSWFALDRLTVIGALQDNAASEATMERQAQATLREALELRVISRELQYQQSVVAVRHATERAEAQHAAARKALQQVAAADDGADRANFTKALTALDALAAAVRHEGTLRSAMLTTRQRDLFQMQPTFESALQSFAKELAAGGVKSGVAAVADGSAQAQTNLTDPVQIALNDYRLAMARMESSALMYLATGRLSAADDVKDAASEADRHMAVVLNGGEADAVKADARTLSVLGKGLTAAAQNVVNQSKQLEAVAEDDVEHAGTAMEQAIGAIAQAFATRAHDASNAAQAGRAAAQRMELLLIGAIALLMLVLGVVATRLIATPIRGLTRAVQAIARGETATPVGHTSRRDETGQMAAAVETLRGVMQKTFVQSQMIEQIPVGVMTAGADTDLRISYVNPETLQIMALVQEHLPVSPEALPGQSVGVFTSDPEPWLETLRNPENLPYRTRIALGDETLEVKASAIRDNDGAYVGPMLIWQRLTGQVRLTARFEGTVQAIAETVGHSADAMRQTAGVLTEVTADSSQRATSVGTAAAQASAHIGTAAAGAEELAASVAEIGRQVAEAARVAGVAVHEAQAADTCVGSLSEAAGRIGDVVKLISDIASRTNLLALNATIEAARAGDAGRGFAVVASEVKSLATQTARATEEIAAQIAAMQGVTSQAVSALRSIGVTIQRMDEIATAIAGAVEEQGAATREIAGAVQQASAGAEAVSGDIAVVSRAVDDSGVRAQEVLEAATSLAQQSAALKGEVAAFFSEMQQAA